MSDVSPASFGPKPRILLVDDRADNLLALKAQLRDQDAELLLAGSGNEALDLLLSHEEVALALVDVQMPEMDGFELAELMRGAERTREIPIIFVTAGLHERARVFKGYEAGAVDFLVKPIEPQILCSKVSVFLQLNRQRRQLAERVLDLEAAQRALVSANDRLKEADERKTQFLAVLSHELRNPLAPIKNSLFLLARAAPGSEQARRSQAVIERQVDQLVRLIDDLLDVTRISRDKIQLQRRRLDLNELLRRTLEDHRSLFENAGVALAVEPAGRPVQVFADWNRVAQIVGNLLSNAAKFTPRGGHVTLSLSADDGARRAVLRVTDDGAGISAEMLERLFQPFVQADRTLDRSKGGLGLGLALIKGLVELHGGTVEARSEGLGRGAQFTVRLPLDRCQPPAPAPGGKGCCGDDTAVGRRVLVIEDNRDSADSLRELLELEGHEVAVAYDGPEGLAKAREFHPEVILCDIGLPGMSGYEVARSLRGDESLGPMCLVALSGYAHPEDLRRAAEAGFDSHLAKPAGVETLREVLCGEAAMTDDGAEGREGEGAAGDGHRGGG